MTLPRTYVGASLVAIAGILFWVLIMPLYDKIIDQREAITLREELIASRTEVIDTVANLTKEFKIKSTEIERFKSIVPTLKSGPELVSSIQAMAIQNGLQLTNISLAGAVSDNTSANPYQEQNISLSLSGSYPAFKSFLMAIERNIRLIDIVSISASPTDGKSSLINFSIKGLAYYLNQ